MKTLAVGLLFVMLAGCGSAAVSKSSGKSTAQSGKVKKPAAKVETKPAAAPKPAPEPKKYVVAVDAYPAIPEALAALLASAEGDGKNDDAIREERYKATAWLALQKDAAVEPLAEKLADESTSLAGKIVICRALGQLGPTAETPLTEALESDEQLVRINAAEQLAIIKPTKASIVQTLIELIDHEDQRTAERAIKSLAHIGLPARDSKDKLLAVLSDARADEGMRSEAKAALKKVNPRKTFQD